MSNNGDGRNYSLDPKNDDYWGHNNKSCPDMQDSVYFTPTSDTPFDPFEVTCLPKKNGNLQCMITKILKIEEVREECAFICVEMF